MGGFGKICFWGVFGFDLCLELVVRFTNSFGGPGVVARSDTLEGSRRALLKWLWVKTLVPEIDYCRVVFLKQGT